MKFLMALLSSAVLTFGAGSPYVTQWPNGDVPGPNRFTNGNNVYVNVDTVSNLNTLSSNFTGMALTRPPSLIAGYDPIGNAEANNGLTLFEFGDSTVEQPQSPANGIGRKFVKRYGFGGWVSDGYVGYDPFQHVAQNVQKTSVETGGPWTGFNGNYGGGAVWEVTNGSTSVVTCSNNQNTACTIWGQQWCAIIPGGIVTWTNDFINGVATPDGAFPGATRCMVFYTITNGLGSFLLQTNINGGGWQTAVTVNCSQPAGVAQVATNASITLATGPNTNHWLMRVVSSTGTCIINFAGMWNEYSGTKVIKFSHGGWQLPRLWHPDWNGILWPQPIIANTASMDNFMQAIPAPLLTMVSTINAGVNDDNGSNVGPWTTHTNLQTQLLYLSGEFNKYNPSNLTVWTTVSPAASSTGGWQYQPEAFRDIFSPDNNFTGHDYVFYVGENSTPDRWNNTLTSGWPHYSWAGGYWVVERVMEVLNAIHDDTVYRAPVYSPSVNGAAMSSYGVDITNGAIFNNHGYSLTVGGDFISTPFANVLPTRTAGQTHVALLGYPTVGSTIPDAAWLVLSTDNRPVTTLAFGGTGFNGQGYNLTNFFTFRNQGVDIWSIGGTGAFLPDGSIDPSTIYNNNHSILLAQNGTIVASNYYGSGLVLNSNSPARFNPTAGQAAVVSSNGTLFATGNISGSVYTTPLIGGSSAINLTVGQGLNYVSNTPSSGTISLNTNSYWRKSVNWPELIRNNGGSSSGSASPAPVLCIGAFHITSSSANLDIMIPTSTYTNYRSTVTIQGDNGVTNQGCNFLFEADWYSFVDGRHQSPSGTHFFTVSQFPFTQVVETNTFGDTTSPRKIDLWFGSGGALTNSPWVVDWKVEEIP